MLYLSYWKSLFKIVKGSHYWIWLELHLIDSFPMGIFSLWMLCSYHCFSKQIHCKFLSPFEEASLVGGRVICAAFSFIGGWRRFSGGTKSRGTTGAHVGEWWSRADVPGETSFFQMKSLMVATSGKSFVVDSMFLLHLSSLLLGRLRLPHSQFADYINLRKLWPHVAEKECKS